MVLQCEARIKKYPGLELISTTNIFLAEIPFDSVAVQLCHFKQFQSAWP